jgi:hypothetical protein
MQTQMLAERLKITSSKITGALFECEQLGQDLPVRLKGFLEEVAQDIDMIVFELSEQPSPSIERGMSL